MTAWLVVFTRCVIGAILLVAAVAKLGRHGQLVSIVFNYRIVPTPLVRPVAALLPAIELIVAVALLTGIEVRYAGASAAALFVLFGLAMAINLARGRSEIACGCFGARGDQEPLRWLYVWRNVGLAGAALATTPWTAPDAPAVDTATAEYASALLAAAVALACWWLGGVFQQMLRRISLEMASSRAHRGLPSA